MDKRIGRKLGAIVATTALSLSLLVPSVAAYDGISVDLGPLNLQRDCGDASGFFAGDAQGQCSYNIAQPSGSQDASAKAIDGNGALTLQGNAQAQINVLKPDANVSNFASVGGAPVSNGIPTAQSGGYFGGGGVSPEAVAVVNSGDVGVSGHYANIDMERLEQDADAGPSGSVIVTNITGGVYNKVWGDNVAVANAGALNNTEAVVDGYAYTNARGASIGGDGGDNAGNIAGNGPEANRFGVDGGFGGSNVNVGVGLSAAGGGFGGGALSGALQAIGFPTVSDGVEMASSSSNNGRGGHGYSLPSINLSNDEAESSAAANGGDARSGFGADVYADQYAGSGGEASFTLTGRGGDASGTNNAYGGAGTLTNTNTLTGNPIATGTANGGTTGDVFAGNQQEANTGANPTTVNMNGGIAGNTLNAGIIQSDPVTGYSGGVTNNGDATACAPITIDQASSPGINMTNTPSQSGANSSTTTQGATSGAQTVSPFQSVTSGAQNAGNIGVQDAGKFVKSFNEDNSIKDINNSNQGNFNVGDVEVELASKGWHR